MNHQAVTSAPFVKDLGLRVRGARRPPGPRGQTARSASGKNYYTLNDKGEGKVAKEGQQLVLGFFADEQAAQKAAAELQGMDRSVLGIKFDNIGIMVKDDKGKVKAKLEGPRHTGLGLVLGGLAAVLTGGLSLIVGVVLGGVLGHFVHKGLGLAKEDLARIGGELDGGKAAVAIMVPESEAKAVTSWMQSVGGVTESHAVSEEVVAEAAAQVAASPEVVEATAPSEPAASA